MAKINSESETVNRQPVLLGTLLPLNTLDMTTKVDDTDNEGALAYTVVIIPAVVYRSSTGKLPEKGVTMTNIMAMTIATALQITSSNSARQQWKCWA